MVLAPLLDFEKLRFWIDMGCEYGSLMKWLIGRCIATEGIELSSREAQYADARAAGGQCAGVGVEIAVRRQARGWKTAN